MVERAMERAGKDILASLDYELVYREAANIAAQTIVTPRLTPEQKREKANAYMRAYKERKKAERDKTQ